MKDEERERGRWKKGSSDEDRKEGRKKGENEE